MTWDDIASWFILASSFATFIALVVAAYEMRENRRERKDTHDEHEKLWMALQKVSVNLLQLLDKFDRREELDRAIDQGKKEGKDVTALVDKSNELRREERKVISATLTAIYNVGVKDGIQISDTVTFRKYDKNGNPIDETHRQS